jgi:hypothetical protein
MGSGDNSSAAAQCKCLLANNKTQAADDPTAAVQGGYYNVGNANNTGGDPDLIICFRDGFKAADVHDAHKDYNTDDIDQDEKQCQPCPDCGDCSVEWGGQLALQAGYVHIGGTNGDVYAFLCDAGTAVTQTDEANYHYIVSKLAIKRCPGGPISMDNRQDLKAKSWVGCREGYAGAFCSSCAEGWTAEKGSLPICKVCSKGLGSTASIRFASFAGLIAVALFIYSRCSSSDTEEDEEDDGGNQESLNGPLMRPIPGQSSINSSEAPTGGRGSRCCCACCPAWATAGVLKAMLKPTAKIIITYMQVVGQVARVFHVPFTGTFKEVSNQFGALITFWDIFISADCIGMHGFTFKWLLRVPGLIFVLSVFIGGWYGSKHCSDRGSSAEDRKQWKTDAKTYAFEGMFLVYPTMCNIAFSAFDCRPLDESGEQTVLVEDDTLLCEGAEVFWLQFASYIVIAVIGIGLPLYYAVKLRHMALKSKLTPNGSPDATRWHMFLHVVCFRQPPVEEPEDETSSIRVTKGLSKRAERNNERLDLCHRDVTGEFRSYSFMTE